MLVQLRGLLRTGGRFKNVNSNIRRNIFDQYSLKQNSRNFSLISLNSKPVFSNQLNSLETNSRRMMSVQPLSKTIPFSEDFFFRQVS